MWSADPVSLLSIWDQPRGRPIDRSVDLLAALSGAGPDEIADQPLGTINRQLLASARRFSGSPLELTADCPSCGIELEVSVGDEMAAIAEAPGPVELPVAGGTVWLRSVTAADLSRALAEPDRAAARSEILAACCRTDGDGEGDGDVDLDFDLDESALIEALAELDDGADLAVEIDCAACGHRWSAPLDPGLLAWSAFDRWARGILSDVEVLAGAFGWSERDILAMSARRRRFYLDGCAVAGEGGLR